MSRLRWSAALVGLMLVVFSGLALLTPGRIDIVDGQTRYEVARSFYEHGDSAIRDERVTFNVFPGADGQRYTIYRLPQSVLGVAAIALADLLYGPSEPARRFVFTLLPPLAASFLALAYALYFRAEGLSHRLSLLWAAGGIFCTPSCYYGTSTFDDILGTTTVVWALLVARLGRGRWWGAWLAGLLVGLAFNCKQPLGIVLLACWGMGYDPRASPRQKWQWAAAVLPGTIFGVAVEMLYESSKFPPSARALHEPYYRDYAHAFPGNFSAALLCLLFSPGAGVIWYCPPALLGLVGALTDRRWMLLASCGVFTLVIASIGYFKGDTAWGPRYLTPVFALLWLLAPIGATVVARWVTTTLLVAGLIVQGLAVTVDPHRLVVESGLPVGLGVKYPLPYYFAPDLSHILNRPRELWAVLDPARPVSPKFTPSHEPTFAFPIPQRQTTENIPRIAYMEAVGPAVVYEYRILNAPRPYWATYWGWESHAPVNLSRVTMVLLTGLAVGVGLLLTARVP